MPVFSHHFRMAVWCCSLLLAVAAPSFAVPNQATSVLLVHGTWSSSAVWSETENSSSQSMMAALTAKGFKVGTANFPTEPETMSNETYIELQAKAIARLITTLKAQSGKTYTNLVCHSMGGLAARYYLEHRELWQLKKGKVAYSGVKKLILLGAPNWGTDGHLLDPVSCVTLAHLNTLPLQSNGYNTTATDTYQVWSPALQEMYAEWEPSPATFGGTYPANYHLATFDLAGGGGYESPMGGFTTLLSDYGLSVYFFEGDNSDYTDIDQATDAFPSSNYYNTGNAYYPVEEPTIGTPFPAQTGQEGVNFRYVSPFLQSLNTTADTSGAAVYMIGGTNPLADIVDGIDVDSPFNGDVANGGIANDGVIPTNSEMGVDPISGSYIYPNAQRLTINTYHTDLPKNPSVIKQVISWLTAK